MNENNQVSIIIPCGGSHAEYICDAVESCLKAKPCPDRIIVVDDDANPAVDLNHRPAGASYSVMMRRLNEHHGRSYARNFGVVQTDTPWLYFLDADDFLEPTAISDFWQIVSTKSPDLIYADYCYIDKNGERVLVAKDPATRRTMAFRNPVNIGMFVRKDRFLAIGGFDEDMSLGEYWDFFLRYAMNPKIKVVKHSRPFFTARQASSVLPNATEMMARATSKIQGMIRGRYYEDWKDR